MVADLGSRSWMQVKHVLLYLVMSQRSFLDRVHLSLESLARLSLSQIEVFLNA